MVRSELVGTWRLADYRLTAADGTVSKPWADARGYIFYAADGHMSCSVERPDGGGGVDHLTYCGLLECLDGENLHTIEMSSRADLRGTKQRRGVRIEGDRMTLTAEPSIAYGPGSKAEIVWKRA
ncbi:MAG: lipocalin-like domain-containing protein [Defluviicoccus sp.]|nr:lipocalin-like domain-containing protein [Defluviicoccus sp.]